MTLVVLTQFAWAEDTRAGTVAVTAGLAVAFVGAPTGTDADKFADFVLFLVVLVAGTAAAAWLIDAATVWTVTGRRSAAV